MSLLSKLEQHLNTPKKDDSLLQSQRLFHGRGHAFSGLHHIVVDWLPPVVLIILYAPEPHSEVELFADWLQLQLPACKSVQVQHRYQRMAPIELLRGLKITNLSILETNNLRFQIRLGQSRNIGLFLDMAKGRQWVFEHSNSKRVLNLFAYTCGFSIAAIAGDAKSVLNIDMSSTALTIGRENHRINQQSLKHVQFEKLNIFKSFGRIKKRGPFDLLICDPPTFQKGSVDINKDYPKILRRLKEFMAPGGTLLLCLNAPELNKEFLINHMSNLAPHYKLVEQINPPEVFTDSEGKGLKTLIFKDQI